MSSPHTFAVLARSEINEPESFLPTCLRYEGDAIIWTKPAYATYRGTPVNHEMADSTILCDPNSTVFPTNMARLAKSKNLTEHQKRYLHDYRFAAATIEHWKNTKHPNENALAQAIAIWKDTCDQLTVNPYFSDGWFLPAFYPVYSYQCIAGIQNFFEQAPILQPGKGKTYWKEQTQQANEMFASWGAYYYYIAAPKNTPFPKCLWYHKYHFAHLLNEPNTWRNFFHDTSFAEWGRNL